MCETLSGCTPLRWSRCSTEALEQTIRSHEEHVGWIILRVSQLWSDKRPVEETNGRSEDSQTF